MNDHSVLTESINLDFSLNIVSKISLYDLKKLLAQRIHFLINNEFRELVQLLYRIDINEARLKQLLAQSNEDAGMLIASLIIERQLEKIESRKKFNNIDDISEEEKW